VTNIHGNLQPRLQAPIQIRTQEAMPPFLPDTGGTQVTPHQSNIFEHCKQNWSVAMKGRITKRLNAAFTPAYLSVVDESHQHSVGKDAQSHWNIVVVSDVFTGLNRVKRHRAVYSALAEEIADGIHALTMKALSPKEWDPSQEDPSNPSPRCLGGSKR